uniref:Uncharacterized protein n=1 Tax=Arundo donax TaxID=35708 RepID=A0A0A8ZY39_ARUDO
MLKASFDCANVHHSSTSKGNNRGTDRNSNAPCGLVWSVSSSNHFRQQT